MRHFIMIFKHCACAKGGNHGYEDITDVDCGDGNKSCVFSPMIALITICTWLSFLAVF